MAYTWRMLKQKPNQPMRLYLINRDFQLRYMTVALGVGVGSTLVTLSVILIPLFQLKILRFPNFLPTPFIWGMIFAACANFVIVAGMSILITHRIAGPMFSMVRYLHLVKERRATVPLRVRENDDLRFLVRNINDFFEFLNGQVRLDSLEIDKALNSLEGAGDVERQQGITILRALRKDLEGRAIPHQGSQETLKT